MHTWLNFWCENTLSLTPGDLSKFTTKQMRTWMNLANESPKPTGCHHSRRSGRSLPLMTTFHAKPWGRPSWKGGHECCMEIFSVGNLCAWWDGKNILDIFQDIDMIFTSFMPPDYDIDSHFKRLYSLKSDVAEAAVRALPDRHFLTQPQGPYEGRGECCPYFSRPKNNELYVMLLEKAVPGGEKVDWWWCFKDHSFFWV